MLQGPPPSVNTTQAPSRRGTSPVGEVVAANEPPEGGSEMVKIIAQDIMDAAAGFFLLRIEDKRTVNANYDPKNAIDNLNAILQDAMEEAVGFEIPTTSYRVLYEGPQQDGSSQGAPDLGCFKIRLPEPLLPYAENLSPPKKPDGPLAFVGDNFGNRYQLTFDVYIERTELDYKPIPSDDPHWFHLIVHSDCRLPERAIRQKLEAHLVNFGMHILDHPQAFKIVPSKDKTQGAGKYHTVYEIIRDMAKTVTNAATGQPFYDMRGLKDVVLGPKKADQATIWIKQELMHKVFNGCNLCFKPAFMCTGCVKEKKPNNKGRMPASQANESAKRRMKEAAGGKAKFQF